MSQKVVISLDARKTLVIVVLLSVIILTTYTYIMALYAFDAPSRDYPLNINNVETLDEDSASKTDFSRGDIVRINVIVEKALSYYWNFPLTYDTYSFFGDTNFKLIILVMDKNEMPVFFDSVNEAVSTGELSISNFDYSVALDATLGTYDVSVFVWNDWLPDGKALSQSIGEVTFTVS